MMFNYFHIILRISVVVIVVIVDDVGATLVVAQNKNVVQNKNANQKWQYRPKLCDGIKLLSL